MPTPKTGRTATTTMERILGRIRDDECRIEHETRGVARFRESVAILNRYGPWAKAELERHEQLAAGSADPNFHVRPVRELRNELDRLKPACAFAAEALAHHETGLESAAASRATHLTALCRAVEALSTHVKDELLSHPDHHARACAIRCLQKR
jgi:hypothetical protein